ncbi:Dolichyl-diphosphooligosaccharide-protein glycosyltransferase subunit dad1 [Dionaea muscipula]
MVPLHFHGKEKELQQQPAMRSQSYMSCSMSNRSSSSVSYPILKMQSYTSTGPARRDDVDARFPFGLIGNRWMEYQGARDWDGLLDPLDDQLRDEILRYGYFVEAAYRSFDFDPSSPTFGRSRYGKRNLLIKSGFPSTGYRITTSLQATSGIQLPARWAELAPSWATMKSSWIGYVAVCHDKKEIARLGRRDVVIAFRGTATCLEWLENLRATLADLPDHDPNHPDHDGCRPMVQSGFLGLYTSSSSSCPSLQDMIRREIAQILKKYEGEQLSFTFTGHSLGAALATLAAYDIKTTFKQAPLVTVISFGGPRVGNISFRSRLEKQGTKVLRIVNPDDLITKVPGFLVGNNDHDRDGGDDYDGPAVAAEGQQTSALWGWGSWLQRRRMVVTHMAYCDVGCELRLMPPEKDQPPMNNFNVAKCHDLKTYLHLVDSFVGSTCPLRKTARRLLTRDQTSLYV